jgi:hypothetical protein
MGGDEDERADMRLAWIFSEEVQSKHEQEVKSGG